MQRAKTGGHILAIFAETQEKQLQYDSATSFMFMVDLKQLAGRTNFSSNVIFFSRISFFFHDCISGPGGKQEEEEEQRQGAP